MNSFVFDGVIPASKSLFNRALIAQSYYPNLNLQGSSNSEDVLHLRQALSHIGQNTVLNCGDGGTTLRFLAGRVSRIPGAHILTGSQRLFDRPQDEILRSLEQLGVRAEIRANFLYVHSEGWKVPRQPVIVRRGESTQFLSSLLLNSWNLPETLKIEMQGPAVSQGYLNMTLMLLRDLGMQIQQQESQIVVAAHQSIQKETYQVESDLSSCFSIAAAALLAGQARLQKFPWSSTQPDLQFVEIFKGMQGRIYQDRDSLMIEKTNSLESVDVNLNSCPDLFPVLAVVCAFAKGVSRLFGAPQLAHKESNRIQKTTELLQAMGVVVHPQNDGAIIEGKNEVPRAEFEFDPDQDHRMAMAAGLLQLKGVKVKLTNHECVNKSFPEFWQIIGGPL